MRLDWPGRSESCDTSELPAGLVFWPVVGSDGEIITEGGATAEIALADNTAMLDHLVKTGRMVDLIYVDPPFLSGQGYTQRIRKGDGLIVKRTYEDRGCIDDYLTMIYPRLVLMKRVLSDHGSIFFHGDRRIIHHVKVLMDEIFGADRLINEIVWTYTGGSDRSRGFAHKHDTILMYAAGDEFTFNQVHVPFSDGAQRRFNRVDKEGRRYKENSLADGRKTKTYMKADGKICPDYWHFNIIVPSHSEHTGYRTQKPAELLRRIIQSASNPGDTVADFFMGSGSTGMVAMEEGRNFIGVDRSVPAFDTAFLRMLDSGTAVRAYRDWQPRGIAEYRIVWKDDRSSLTIADYNPIELPDDTKFSGTFESGLRLVAIIDEQGVQVVSLSAPFAVNMPDGDCPNHRLLTLDDYGIVTVKSI